MFTTIYDDPSGVIPAAAHPIVQAAIESLDRVNDAIEREVAKANLGRHAIGNLIDRLIAQLDAADGDTDLEPSFNFVVPGFLDEQEDEDEHGGDVQDQPHDEDHYSSPDLELTSCENWGGGFTMNGGSAADDAEDSHDQEWDPSDLEPSLGWTGIGNTRGGGQYGVLDGEVG